jgi:hypothetical protein
MDLSEVATMGANPDGDIWGERHKDDWLGEMEE